jgi:hypothetical protein
MAWRCFLVEHRGEMIVYLRRYRWDFDGGPDCSQGGWHSARSQALGRLPSIWSTTEDGHASHASPDIKPWLIDHRWPTHCGCGYAFTDDDKWTMDHELIYVDVVSGREYVMSELPIGAMFDNGWGWHKGPDGKSISVKLPPGGPHDFWDIDSRATSGGYWERTGESPDLVVTPSIQSGQYHGFLGSNTAPAPGWLSDPL